MRESMVGPVDVLLQRQQLMQDITELARVCGWEEQRIQELLVEVWESFVRIDNETFVHAKETGDEMETIALWRQGMVDMQHWLSDVLGIEVDFVF